MAIAGDLLASGATMQCNVPAKGWNAGAVMADASLNRRQTIRVGAIVAFAQVGIVGFDGQIELEAEVPLDRPRRAPGATALTDVTVSRARAGDLATASLMSSTRFIELDAAVWSNNTVRVMARNISGATFDLAAATLSVGVAKRRVP